MTTATTGTGTITLGSAVSGYLSFATAGVANGEVVSYGIKDGANSEVGTGTYTSAGTTLTRTVTKSTNSDAAISLSGSAEVYITARAQDIAPIIDVQTFTSSGTWTKPVDGRYTMALVRLWAGGGSGGKGVAASPGGGGGGGACHEMMFPISLLGATETVTIGAGGTAQSTNSTNGNVGGNTTFGAHLTAYGGGGGAASAGGANAGDGGAGGGAASAGGTLNTVGQPDDNRSSGVTGTRYHGGGVGQTANTEAAAGNSVFGGGGGGAGRDAAGAGGNTGGTSFWGGGGGGGAANSGTAGAGGNSTYGGDGGAGAIDSVAATAGTQPGGGGGGVGGGTSSAAGAAGQCIVYCW